MKYVLDSGFFMNVHFQPQVVGEFYICNSVLDEIKSSTAKNVYDMFIAKKKVTILDPENKYLKKINEVAKKMGQTLLSYPDKELLALALMLSEYDPVVICTDDFGIRNIGFELKINSIGSKTEGGLEKRNYKFKCNGCSSFYINNENQCDVCGHNKFTRVRKF